MVGETTILVWLLESTFHSERYLPIASAAFTTSCMVNAPVGYLLSGICPMRWCVGPTANRSSRRAICMVAAASPSRSSSSPSARLMEMTATSSCTTPT